MDGFGARLAYAREKEGLLQKELANMIGVEERNISDYETGKYVPKDEIKVKLSKALHISLDFLLGANENPEDYAKYQVLLLPDNTPPQMLKEIEAYVELMKLKYKI